MIERVGILTTTRDRYMRGVKSHLQQAQKKADAKGMPVLIVDARTGQVLRRVNPRQKNPSVLMRLKRLGAKTYARIISAR